MQDEINPPIQLIDPITDDSGNYLVIIRQIINSSGTCDMRPSREMGPVGRGLFLPFRSSIAGESHPIEAP